MALDTGPPPVISVVVATYNRATALPGLVASIEAQRDVAGVEIIVVDDGSTDGTALVLEGLASDGHASVVPVCLAVNGGPAHARNVGWRLARAPLIAFTDDDCLPQPGWLAGLVAGLAEADLVQGRTLPNPDHIGRLGAFSRTVECVDGSHWYETCNMGYRRELLESLEGFDEGFRRPYGEDIDLALRAIRRGARSAFSPEAVVFHAVWASDYRRHLREMLRRDGLVRVVRAHPEFRQTLYYRMFWKPSHPLALLAAIGIGIGVLPGRKVAARLAALILIAPYVRHYQRHFAHRRSPHEPPGVIAKALLGDWVEIGVLARASLRYRALVL